MDQPQNENTTTNNDTNPSDNTAPIPGSEVQSTSVPITVTTSTSTDATTTEPEVHTEDPALASVESELQALEAQQFDESGNPTGVTGVDPMEQIKADAEAEQVPITAPAEPLVMPAEEPTEQPMAVEPEPMDAPEENSQELPDETLAEAHPAEETSSMSEDAPQQDDSKPLVSTPGVISDIIAPSSTSVAEAEGTAGTNVITGTPEPIATEAASSTPPAQKSHEPKSKKGLLIAIVIIVTLLFGGAAVAAYVLSPAKDTADSTNSVESTDTALTTENSMDTATPGETVEAATLDDYKAVCGGGMVTNATAFDGAGPHPIVIFEKGSDDQFAMNVLAFTDSKWSASASDVTSARLVGCISRVVASETKLKSCPITDATTKVTVNVDYYSSDYNVEVLNAKTGESLTKYKIASTSTLCPTTAVYDKVDPKIFATYDVAALETSLKDLVTKTVN